MYWNRHFYAWLKDGTGEEVDVNGVTIGTKSYVLNNKQ